ncbi:hypothetical protein [Natronospora cellulosivora (SeqCode)]
MVVKEEFWEELIEFLEEFAYIEKGNKELYKNKDFVWELIINIKQHMKEKVEQGIRINLELCYLLDINNEEEIKNINSAMFKLNYIFDQDIYRFDYPTDKGLKYFHKILNTTYGNLDNFIRSLNDVKENLSFIRKRKDCSLIERYDYIKKISLPLTGYEDLRMALLKLLEKYKEVKTLIIEPCAFNSFINELDEFIELYQSIYLREHNLFHNRLNNFYKKLYSLQEYKSLEYLSMIDVIKVAYSLRPIQKYIDTFFPEQCNNTKIKDTLNKKTKCNCGFTIGDILTIPSLNKIKPMLRKGILEYIEKIQNEKFKSLFENYTKYNKESMIYKFMESKTDKVNGNLKYIDKKLVKEINEALSNTYPLKISIDEIASYLTGTYPANQLDLLAKDLKESLKKLINNKIKGIENNNFDDIIINIEY